MNTVFKLAGNYIDHRSHSLTKDTYDFWIKQDKFMLDEHLSSNQPGSQFAGVHNIGTNFGNLYKVKGLIIDNNLSIITPDGDVKKILPSQLRLVKEIKSSYWLDVSYTGSAIITYAAPTENQVTFNDLTFNYVIKDNIKILDSILYTGKETDRGIDQYSIDKKTIELKQG